MKHSDQAITGIFPEWSPQSAVLIAWPDQYTDFASTLDTVETTYLKIVNAIVPRQLVIIAVRDQRLKTHVAKQLAAHQINPKQIIYVQIPYDDIWVRDIAPIAVQHNQSTNLLCFQFNAWGNQYHCQNDAKFAQCFVASHVLAAPLQICNLNMEGGAFDSDGLGKLLTTASCIYDPKRNNSEKISIHQILKKSLNANQLIVLEHGQLTGDDTGGHIDTLARFCSENTIAYTSCNDPDDANYQPLQQLHDQLQQLRTTNNTAYQLIPLPIPAAIFDDSGQKLPTNYVNFLIINQAVLVPQYNDAHDKIAISKLGHCFPDRKIIPIDCRSLIAQFGSLHCMTMNYPFSLKPERIQ
jgi:agmatine/peptidylarginine deiminase